MGKGRLFCLENKKNVSGWPFRFTRDHRLCKHGFSWSLDSDIVPFFRSMGVRCKARIFLFLIISPLLCLQRTPSSVFRLRNFLLYRVTISVLLLTRLFQKKPGFLRHVRHTLLVFFIQGLESSNDLVEIPQCCVEALRYLSRVIKQVEYYGSYLLPSWTSLVTSVPDYGSRFAEMWCAMYIT